MACLPQQNVETTITEPPLVARQYPMAATQMVLVHVEIPRRLRDAEELRPMTVHRADLYRLRFDRWLRFGTPIDLPLERKDDPMTDRYVWRARRDAKVRRSHRANDGRIFSWNDPPETGNPGEDPNCRCEAIPYRPGETEFAYHTFTSGLASSYERWEDSDPRRHRRRSQA